MWNSINFLRVIIKWKQIGESRVWIGVRKRPLGCFAVWSLWSTMIWIVMAWCGSANNSPHTSKKKKAHSTRLYWIRYIKCIYQPKTVILWCACRPLLHSVRLIDNVVKYNIKTHKQIQTQNVWTMFCGDVVSCSLYRTHVVALSEQTHAEKCEADDGNATLNNTWAVKASLMRAAFHYFLILPFTYTGTFLLN